MFVVIRVDASVEIGLGHLQRCLALAHALREEGVRVQFVTRALGVEVAARISMEGFASNVLPPPSSQQTASSPAHASWAGVPWCLDALETATSLQRNRPDWVVVDSYSFDRRWHCHVADALGVKVAVIDDLADRPLGADLLIDHNVSAVDHRVKYAGLIGAATTVLGGPPYALLGPTYANAARYVMSDKVRSIGIFLGGTDPAKFNELVLRACRESLGFRGAIEVATTTANPRHHALTVLAMRWPQTRVLVDAPDLSRFFARHDLQVGAGGGAIWERCCIGAPTLAVICAENQLLSLPLLDGLGVVDLASIPDDWQRLNEVQLAAALGALINDADRRSYLATQSQKLVDGRGAIRVAQWMTSRKGTVL